MINMEMNHPSFLISSSTHLNTAAEPENTYQPSYLALNPQMIVMANNPPLYSMPSLPVYTVTNGSSLPSVVESSQLSTEAENMNSPSTDMNPQQPQVIPKPKFFSSTSTNTDEYHRNFNNSFSNFASSNALGNGLGSVAINSCIDKNLVLNNSLPTIDSNIMTSTLPSLQNEAYTTGTEQNTHLSDNSTFHVTPLETCYTSTEQNSEVTSDSIFHNPSLELPSTKEAVKNIRKKCICGPSVKTMLQNNASEVRSTSKRKLNVSTSSCKRKRVEKVPSVTHEVKFIDVMINSEVQNGTRSVMKPWNFQLKPPNGSNFDVSPDNTEVENTSHSNENQYFSLQSLIREPSNIEYTNNGITQNKSTAEQAVQTEIYCWLFKNGKLYTTDNGDVRTDELKVVTVDKANILFKNLELERPENSKNSRNHRQSQNETEMATENNAETLFESSTNIPLENFELDCPENLKKSSNDRQSQNQTEMAKEDNSEILFESSTNIPVDNFELDCPENSKRSSNDSQSQNETEMATEDNSEILFEPSTNIPVENFELDCPENSINSSNDRQSQNETEIATEDNSEILFESSTNIPVENFELDCPENSKNSSNDRQSQNETEMETEDNEGTVVESSNNPSLSVNVKKNKFIPTNVFDETLYTILGVYTAPKSVVEESRMTQSSVEPEVEVRMTQSSVEPEVEVSMNDPPNVIHESHSVPSSIQNEDLISYPKTNLRSDSGISISSNKVKFLNTISKENGKVAPAYAKVGDMVYEDIRSCQLSDEYGNIPLHLAVIYEDLSKLKRQCIVLKCMGSHLNHTNFQNETALMVAVKLAVETGKHEAVSLLVAEGADQTIVDRDGSTPLYYAVKCGCVEIVRILLSDQDSHKVVEQFSHDGLVPLHQAAIEGHDGIISLLLNNKVDVNIKDLKSGRTAYFHAIDMGKTEVAKILLKFGANPNITNYAGNLPSPTRTSYKSIISSGKTEHTAQDSYAKSELSEGTNNLKLINNLTESTSNCLCQHHLPVQDLNFSQTSNILVSKNILSDSLINNKVNNSVANKMTSPVTKTDVTNQVEMLDCGPNSSSVCVDTLDEKPSISQSHLNSVLTTPHHESLGTTLVKDNILTKPNYKNPLCELVSKVRDEESLDTCIKGSNINVKSSCSTKLSEDMNVEISNLSCTVVKQKNNTPYTKVNHDDIESIKRNKNTEKCIPVVTLSDDETYVKPQDVKIEEITLDDDIECESGLEQCTDENKENEYSNQSDRGSKSDPKSVINEEIVKKEYVKTLVKDIKIEVITLDDNTESGLGLERSINEEKESDDQDDRCSKSVSGSDTNKEKKEKKYVNPLVKGVKSEVKTKELESKITVVELGQGKTVVENNEEKESGIQFGCVDSGGATTVLLNRDCIEPDNTSDNEKNNSIDLHNIVFGNGNGLQNNDISSNLQLTYFSNTNRKDNNSEKECQSANKMKFQVSFDTIFSSIVGGKGNVNNKLLNKGENIRKTNNVITNVDKKIDTTDCILLLTPRTEKLDNSNVGTSNIREENEDKDGFKNTIETTKSASKKHKRKRKENDLAVSCTDQASPKKLRSYNSSFIVISNLKHNVKDSKTSNSTPIKSKKKYQCSPSTAKSIGIRTRSKNH